MTPDDLIPETVLPKWLLPTLLGACLVIFGLWGRSCYLRHEAKQQATQSDRHDQAGIIHAAQGALHDQQAEAKAPTLEANAAEVARLRAEVARLRKAAAPKAPFVSELQSLPPPVLLEDAKDQLIDALTKENVDLKAALAEYKAGSASWKAAYGESQKALACLRIALSKHDKDRPWSVGVRLERKWDGTTQAGITARRDLGPGYVEGSGFGDRAGIGFGWRF